jgi:hypothetical protein
MRRIAFAAAVTTGVVFCGCQTVTPISGPMPGAEKFSYSAGKAVQEFAYPPSALQSAITQGMDDLRIQSVRQTNDSGSYLFSGTTADNRHVQVIVRPSLGASRISIRIGWWGDEPLSRALMDRIGIRLGTLPAAAIPVDPPSSPSPNPFFSKKKSFDPEILREQADAPYRDSPVPQ